MKESSMNVDSLSKQELLMLLSILEGELEAQDLVIHTLRSQHRDVVVQKRYGQYDLSDPFMALQRDSEVLGDAVAGGDDGMGGAGGVANPLSVLKLLMAHCRRMQERMKQQLTAAEIRHRRVISDLEEERRRHAQDTADGDDVTYMLEKERQKLLQQLECERSRQQQLEQECERAVSKAQEESERATGLESRLQEECSTAESLQGEVEHHRSRAESLEATQEKQLAEFDTEREQLKAKLRKEEHRSKELLEQLEALRKELREREAGTKEKGEKERENKKEKQSSGVERKERGEKDRESGSGGGGVKERATSGGEVGVKEKTIVKQQKERGGVKLTPVKVTPTSPNASSNHSEVDGKSPLATRAPPPSRLNGHTSHQSPSSKENGVEAGPITSGARPASPAVTTPIQSPTPTSPASSSLVSSPISSPNLSKRGVAGHAAPYPPSFQSGVNQRFQAARHKFAQAEQDAHTHTPHTHSHPHTPTHTLSPRDLSPTTTPPPQAADNSAAKQLARNTVTQVLSRFTSQQQQGGGKMAPLSSSPFGTDYRTLTSPTSSSCSSPTSSSSPTVRSPVPGACPLSPTVRSPIISRSSDKTLNSAQPPPPVPPKSSRNCQSPASPGVSRSSGNQSPASPGRSGSSHFPELSGGCGMTSAAGGDKDIDLVVSSSS